MGVLKREVDIKLNEVTAGAPAEYDTLNEVATSLNSIKLKTDLITITQPKNLDNIGTIADFEAAL